MKAEAVRRYKCARCGVPCITWLDGWKHAGGWHTPKSCGKPPVPVAVFMAPRLTPVSVEDAARMMAQT